MNQPIEELKPCPFCGGRLVPFGHEFDEHRKPVQSFIHPTKSKVRCPLNNLVFTKEKWNMRVKE